MILELISFIPPMPMSSEVTKFYGLTRAKLEKLGKSIGNNDLWIAAHALTLGSILVTNNLKEFSRVALLKVENWVSV